jgi:non-homologous end joining protein Ku
MSMINRKIESGGRALPQEPRRRKQPSNVIDLAAILQKSLDQSSRRPRSRAASRHTGKKVA